MALTIQLTPEQEALLHEEALAHGMEARAYAEKLLAERLAEATGNVLKLGTTGRRGKRADATERTSRVKAVRGFLAGTPGSVEEFLREKHAEKEREELVSDLCT